MYTFSLLIRLTRKLHQPSRTFAWTYILCYTFTWEQRFQLRPSTYPRRSGDFDRPGGTHDHSFCHEQPWCASLTVLRHSGHFVDVFAIEGPWFFHCHIDWHLNAGFGMCCPLWRVYPVLMSLLAAVFVEDQPDVASVDHPPRTSDL